MSLPTPTKAKDVFTPDELRELTQRSTAAGLWAIASTWGIIALVFAALARWPHPITFVLAVIVLGGRQLALAILMHEASHRTLFAHRILNDVLTDWLCARPVWNDVARYRKHHMGHHAHAGSDRDPDQSLSAAFPTSRGSLLRKFLRDLLGISAVKRVLGLFLMDIEVLEYTVAAVAVRKPRGDRRFVDYVRAGLRNMSGMVLTNLVLAGVLAAAGHLWLYWAWAAAYFTTFGLFLRIRSMAEHACTERGSNPFRNTRTTRAGWLARMTVAPCHVNYHVEHHLLVAVPYYRLPKMHRMLRERGAPGAFAPSYASVLQTVTSDQPAV
ncbi:fatty acid desaturase family protein [Pendulispora albinea]|uniref:Fatty acid desaturase family protein n=1 Tax=Pendulispora albinea TaxID=2741071 RepID=A0ABZ2LRB6_9BACT